MNRRLIRAKQNNWLTSLSADPLCGLLKKRARPTKYLKDLIVKSEPQNLKK